MVFWVMRKAHFNSHPVKKVVRARSDGCQPVAGPDFRIVDARRPAKASAVIFVAAKLLFAMEQRASTRQLFLGCVLRIVPVANGVNVSSDFHLWLHKND